MNSMMESTWAKHVRPEHAGWTYRLLKGLYGEPDRSYHTRQHIEECLGLLHELTTTGADGTIDRELAELALLWHDAVYVPGQPDNEINSLALLEGLRFTLRTPLRATKAIPLIMATRHKAEEGTFGDVTVDAVVDIDLSVLGRERANYMVYVAQIRREFASASDEAWRMGRAIFLEEMLSRKRIYQLDAMRERFEERARANMLAELIVLSKQAG